MKYELNKKIGGGWNAEVYKISNDRVKKILKLSKEDQFANKKKIERFKRETDSLKDLENIGGVMPMLESYFPKNPNHDDLPFYIMPLAKTFNNHFAKPKNFNDIKIIVEAIWQIAKTLEKLQSNEKKYIHRDIKPENLFVLNGKYIIGDFGLIKHSFVSEISDKEEKIGPKWYIAPEMLNNKNEEDIENYLKVDVYSLAKTLWKLITGENYPLMGQHNIFYRDFWLRSYLDFELSNDNKRNKIGQLDYLLQNATMLNPEKRMSIQELKKQLEIWLGKIQIKNVSIENMDLTNLRSLISPGLDSFSLLQEKERRKNEIAGIINNKLLPTKEMLAKKLDLKNPNINLFKNNGIIERNLLKGDRRFITDVCILISRPETEKDGKRRSLFSGLAIEIKSDDKCEIIAGHFLHKNNEQEIEIWRSEKKSFLYNIPEQEEVINEVVSELKESYKNIAIEKYEHFLK